MLTVDEALALVMQHAQPRRAVEMPATDALGRVLAEDVPADLDSPPYNKSAVDGYALIADDLSDGTGELEVLEEVVAGDVPRETVRRGQCTRIMTGAPIPPGADAVVMIERTELMTAAGKLPRVRITNAPTRQGQNIVPRGCSMRAGDLVLRSGCVLRPAELGLLAEVGRSRVRVVQRPTAAVLSTGNEIVPADEIPSPGQIRNSNGPMLAACVRSAGCAVIDLGIVRDDADVLREAIGKGLEADVLILSGGVSAGVLDLVPAALTVLGVRQVFHKVHLKPGKPLWFGVSPGSASRPTGTLVFGLPGNPVSSLVCFELFVRPAIARISGQQSVAQTFQAQLATEFTHRGDRPTYHPASLSRVGSQYHATPLRWAGSADLRALTTANSLLCFPAGDRSYSPGDTVTVHLL